MPQSKFGGIPIEDEQPASKFGGQPVAAGPAKPAPKSVAELNAEAAARPDPYRLRTPILADPNREDLGTKVAGAVLGGPAASMHTLGRGLNGVAHPSSQPISDTAADIIEGGAGVALPFAVPSMLARPGVALAGLGAGVAGRGVGSKIATMAGVSPGASRLIGDAAGAAAGGAASVGASRISPAGVKGALSGGLEAAKEIPLVGKILRVPEGMARGYQAATAPRPLFGPWPPPEGLPRLAPLGEAHGEIVMPLPPGVEGPAWEPSPAPQAPTPFRERYGIPKGRPKGLGRGQLFEPEFSPAPTRAGAPQMSAPAGPGSPRKVEVQHFGDMRLPRNQPKPIPGPKMYDSFGRPLPPR